MSVAPFIAGHQDGAILTHLQESFPLETTELETEILILNNQMGNQVEIGIVDDVSAINLPYTVLMPAAIGQSGDSLFIKDAITGQLEWRTSIGANDAKVSFMSSDGDLSSSSTFTLNQTADGSVDLNLATQTAVVAGNYDSATLTVNEKGIITSITAGSTARLVNGLTELKIDTTDGPIVGVVNSIPILNVGETEVDAEVVIRCPSLALGSEFKNGDSSIALDIHEKNASDPIARFRSEKEVLLSLACGEATDTQATNGGKLDVLFENMLHAPVNSYSIGFEQRAFCVKRVHAHSGFNSFGSSSSSVAGHTTMSATPMLSFDSMTGSNEKSVSGTVTVSAGSTTVTTNGDFVADGIQAGDILGSLQDISFTVDSVSNSTTLIIKETPVRTIANSSFVFRKPEPSVTVHEVLVCEKGLKANGIVSDVTTPVISSDAATKGYVDQLAQGLSYVQEVDVASFGGGNVSNSSNSTSIKTSDDGAVQAIANIDGIDLTTLGKTVVRILLTDQSDAKENGVWEYTVATTLFSRPSDFASGGSASNKAAFCDRGSTNERVGFVCTNQTSSDVIDTDDLTFVRFTNSSFSVNTANLHVTNSVEIGLKPTISSTHAFTNTVQFDGTLSSANSEIRFDKSIAPTVAETGALDLGAANAKFKDLHVSGGIVGATSIDGPVASSSALGVVKVDGTTITANSTGVISSAQYTLPTASTTVLGGIKVDGTTISIDGSGVISSAQYTLPTASTTVLGGIKVDGSTVTIDATGVVSSAQYTLPTASTTVLGGIKVDGSTVTIDATGVVSSAQYTLPTASSSTLGGLKTDDTTIFVDSGTSIVEARGLKNGTSAVTVANDGAIALVHGATTKLFTTASGIEVSDATDLATIQIGAPNGGFIDFAGPATDDHDVRLRAYPDGRFIISGFDQVTSKEYAKFNFGGSVELLHDGSKTLETTATGAQVTGELTIDNGASTTSLLVKNQLVPLLSTDIGSNVGDFIVEGTSTFGGVTHFSSTVRMGEKFRVKGTTNSTSLTSGAVRVNGGTAIAKNLHLGGVLDLSGSLSTNVSVSGTTVTDDSASATFATLDTPFSLSAGDPVSINGELLEVLSVTSNTVIELKSPPSFGDVSGASMTLGAGHISSGGNPLRVGSSKLEFRVDSAASIEDMVNNKTVAQFTTGASDAHAELYYNNELRMETTNAGITVTGGIQVTETDSGQYGYIDCKGPLGGFLDIGVGTTDYGRILGDATGLTLTTMPSTQLPINFKIYNIVRSKVDRLGMTVTSHQEVDGTTGLTMGLDDAKDENAYFFGFPSENGTTLNSKAVHVTAGNFVAGQKYIIRVPGNTDFTAVGAANSNMNTIFTATGAGSGTGEAAPVQNYFPVLCGKTGGPTGFASTAVFGQYVTGNASHSGEYTYIAQSTTDAGAFKDFRFLRDGNFEMPSGGTAGNHSDYRLKKDFVYDFNALDLVSRLKPLKFQWIGDEIKHPDGTTEVLKPIARESDNPYDCEYGFLAHEVDQVLPSVVSGKKDQVDANGNVEAQAMYPTKLIGVLTKAIQELKAENDTLKAQMASVLTRLQALES